MLLDATVKSHNSNMINLKIDPGQTMDSMNKKNLINAKKQLSNFAATQDYITLEKIKPHMKRSDKPNYSPKKQVSKIKRQRLKSAFVLTDQLTKSSVTNSQNLIAESDVLFPTRTKQRSPQSTNSKPGSTQISRADFYKNAEAPYGPLISVNRSIHSFINQNRFDIRTKSLTTAQNVANMFLQQY